MKKLFSFIFAACMAVTAFAAEEVSSCPAGTLVDGKVIHELECCTIVQEQGESTTALKSVSPWQAPSKSIMTITPKPGVSIEKFAVNTKNTTLGTYLGKAELTNATKVTTANTIVTFAVTDPTQPVVMKFVSTTIKFAELTITYTGGATTEPEPEQPTVTYTVAGSSEAAFGTTWAADNAANDMTLQADGTYKWEKTGLELLKGSLDFKVCKDHAWTTAYPGTDYSLAIPETGIYTVTITFNPTTEEVNATATKTGDVDIIPTVAMHGNFAGPDAWADTENYTIAADNKTATLVMTLAVGNYEFGMRIGGKGDWTANGVAFARDNASAEVVKGAGNLTLAADVAGEYTFTWTYATNTLVITFPAKSTVGFENIEATENAVKFIENGKIFIIREGNIYDATGARVK